MEDGLLRAGPRVEHGAIPGGRNALGLGGTASAGQTERHQGRGEYDASRAEGWTEGAGDRVTGKKGSVVGSVTGDRSQQHSGEWNSRRKGVPVR